MQKIMQINQYSDQKINKLQTATAESEFDPEQKEIEFNLHNPVQTISDVHPTFCPGVTKDLFFRG
jgi:hypothetical protein